MKEKAKKNLKEQNNLYLKIIYSGFINQKSPKQIHKELYDATINNKQITNPNAFIYAKRLTDKLYKQLPPIEYASKLAELRYNAKENSEIAMGMLVYGLITHFKAIDNFNKSVNIQANKIETELKEKVIEDVIENNRNNAKIFYLSSSHKDCAKDHLEAQGKIYYDKNWRNAIIDTKTKIKISEFIKKNNLKSIQWVMGDPVWFITRPNCRHYFVALTTREVLRNSTKRLEKKHKTNTAIGNRQYLQTLKSDNTTKIIGEKRNAELMVIRYKERLEIHTQLYKINRNPLLQRAIVKDKMLIKKWYDYARKL